MRILGKVDVERLVDELHPVVDRGVHHVDVGVRRRLVAQRHVDLPLGVFLSVVPCGAGAARSWEEPSGHLVVHARRPGR